LRPAQGHTSHPPVRAIRPLEPRSIPVQPKISEDIRGHETVTKAQFPEPVRTRLDRPLHFGGRFRNERDVNFFLSSSPQSVVYVRCIQEKGLFHADLEDHSHVEGKLCFMKRATKAHVLTHMYDIRKETPAAVTAYWCICVDTWPRS
jgi:hypothetical protein